jgi:hypothetical protein
MQAERREQKLAMSLEHARADASQRSLDRSPPVRSHLAVAGEQPEGRPAIRPRLLDAQADDAALTVRHGAALMREDVSEPAQAEAS